MAYCVQTDYTIPGDNEKGTYKRICKELAHGNSIKETALAAYFVSKEFADYLESKTGERDYKKIQPWNKLQRLLKDFYNEGNLNVLNSATRRQGSTYIFGFESVDDMRQAEETTISYIIDEYIDSLKNHKSPKIILTNVANRIFSEFIDRYGIPVWNELDENNTYKKEVSSEYYSLLDRRKSLLSDIKKLKDDIKNAKDKELKKGIKEQIKTAQSELSSTENDIFNILYETVRIAGDIRSKAYSTLAYQIRVNPNRWFNKVFISKKVNRYKREFEGVLEDDNIAVNYYEDTSNFKQNPEDDIDLESRRWADDSNRHSSFTELVDLNTKLYLASIRRLRSNKKINSNNTESWDYDTDNVLGTANTVGADYLIAQLSSICSTYSLPLFIKSIERGSSIPGLECLAIIAEDCKNNKHLAYKLFHELNSYVVNKTIIDITDDIHNAISNTSADNVSTLFYNLQNIAKFTIKDNFSDSQIDEISTELDRHTDYDSPAYQNPKIQADCILFLKKYLNIYFPQLPINTVESYLTQDLTTFGEKYYYLLNDVFALIRAAQDVLKDENTIKQNYYRKDNDWKTKRRDNPYDTTPKPVLDYLSIPYYKLNNPIVSIAQKLAPHIAVQNELNSFNAEGNLGSDLIENNYLTNLIKQINYSTPEDEYAGLRALGEFVFNTPQYKHSPIFFGAKDSTGKVVFPGLFIDNGNGTFSINENAKKHISIALFNGVRDQMNNDSKLYNNMSKADYFMSVLINYHSPAIPISQRGIGGIHGYFLRTPADAPKNFVINMPGMTFNDLFGTDETSRQEYIARRKEEVLEQLNFGTNNVATKVETKNVGVNSSEISFEEILNLLTNPPTVFDATNYATARFSNKDYVVFRIPVGDSFIKIAFEGTKTIKNKSIQFTNLKPNSAYSPLLNDNSFSKGAKLNSFNNFIAGYLNKEGLKNGGITRIISHDNGIYCSLREHLINELNTFIFNLNNVIETKGTFRTKSNVHGLFDRYHYKNGSIVKNGKLTGNVFSFRKLFKIGNYDVDKELVKVLSLYGQGKDSLLIPDGVNTLRLNLTHSLIKIDNLTGKISLNENALGAAFDKVVENWIYKFSEEIAKKSIQYQTVLDGNYSTYQVQEAMFNTAIAYMNFDDLFEGDTKFYKDSRDFFKRAKEVQASGKSYGAIDFNAPLGCEIMPAKDVNGNNEIIKIGNIEIPLYTGFKGVTIKNTVRISDNAEQIYKEMLNVNNSLPKSTRERIALQIAKGFGYKNEKYGATKTNDAQSYITIEEFIRRLYLSGGLEDFMQGEFKNILPTLLNPNATPEEIAKLDIQKLNKFIQVQKNFYFDKQKDSATNTVYSRQIKNAEFVLIPALIKGTSLGQLYDIMKKHGIGQINTAETDKAAKRIVLEYWDNDGKVTDEALKKFDSDLSDVNNIENYYYRYLYKQQQVAQHMQDKTNKAGIQFMKKILDNSTDEVRTDVDNFFNAFIANIREDYYSFLDDMGWKEYNGRIVDKETNDAIKFNNFYKRAREESERLGLDSNFVDYVTIDEHGNPIMPDFMNVAATKFENIAQSMFNRGITRQTLPGWHAAQVTSVGYSHKLKFDPETGVMEVLLPRWAVNIPKDYDISKLAEEGLDLHIGYRIPTEGKQSISILRVVGFLDDTQGSTIIVPDEWVTKTGSDFDVDSVYGICFKHRIDKETKKLIRIKPILGDDEISLKERYMDYIQLATRDMINKNGIEYVYDLLSTDKITFNSVSQINSLYRSAKGIDFLVGNLGLMGINKFSKLSIIEQNTRDARDNMILEAAIHIMQSPTTREENYSRSNYDNLTDSKDFVDYLRKRYSNETDYQESTYNPFDQVDYMENAMSGASLKAASVNRDTFNSICNFSKAVLNRNNAITVTYDLTETVKEVQDGELVDTGRLKYDLDTILAAYPDAVVSKDKKSVTVTHNRWAWSANNRNILGMLITCYSSQTTSHILDAVKVGSLFNENQFTFGVFKTMVDLGIDYDTAVMFLQQPIITEIVNAYNETNSIYANVNGRPIEVALARLAKKAGFNVNGREINDNTSQYTIFKMLSEDSDIQDIVIELTGGEITENGKLKNGVFTLSGKRLQERFNKAKISKININNSTNSNNKILFHKGTWTRNEAANDTKSLYVFTDNTDRDSGSNIIDENFPYAKKYGKNKHYPTVTQAVVRGLPNAMPISTQRYYHNGAKKESGRWTDNESNLFEQVLKEEINDIITEFNTGKYNKLVIKSFKDLVNTKISNISKERTPKLYNILQREYNRLINSIDNTALNNSINNNLNDNSLDYTLETFVEDLLTLMHFANIYHTTANMEKIRRCTNPDKFGAKQSIFATRTVIENIKKYIREDDEIKELFKVGDVSFLEALYPNITSDNININESCYKYLAAFMKYATMTSVDINSKIFTLERSYIHKQMLKLQDSLGFRFTEETNAEFKRYLVTCVYDAVEQLTTPFTVDDKSWFQPIDIDPTNTKDIKTKEIDRIFGYVEELPSSIALSSILNPTDEDIELFMKLTPAKKVIFIKNHFKDKDGGIFNYINVNHFKNKDILRYNDSLGNIEDLYIAFNQSFFNTNKLIRLASLDLIKYAFVVEGFKFKKGAISKIITNDALLAPKDQQGVGFDETNRRSIVESIMTAMNNFQLDNNFIEKFVRSHSEYLKPIKIGKAYKNSFSYFFANHMFNNGVFFIPNTDTEKVKSLRNGLKLDVDELGNVRSTVKYIKIYRINNKKNTNILYKLKYTKNGVYGYPLNTLEQNEVQDISFNNDNNKYRVPAYYETIIKEYEATNKIVSLNSPEYGIPEHVVKKNNESITNVDYLIDINMNGTKIEHAITTKLFSDINAWYHLPLEERADTLLVHNESPALKHIIPYGINVYQNVMINGEKVLVAISRYRASKAFKTIVKYNAPSFNNPFFKDKVLKQANKTKLSVPEANIIEDVKSSGIAYPSLYSVTLVNTVDLNTEGPSDIYGDVFNDDYGEDYNERSATTTPIDLDIEVIEHPFNSIDQVAKDAAEAIHSEHRNNPSEHTAKFKKAVKHIDFTSTDEIHENSKEIYHEAAEYYTNKANELLDKINGFVLDESTGETYDIGNEELYKKLLDYMLNYETLKEDKDKREEFEKLNNKYNELVKLILDCYTFGNQFSDITSLDLQGEDAELTETIEKLKTAINKIQNNTKVKKAMKNIFDIYLAESTSKNPMIIYSKTHNTSHGLLNLRDTFNDTGYFDGKISDIGFINNKQVQVVVKYINSRINAVTRFDVPEAVAEFDAGFDEIMKMAGTLNWKNIIDNDGKLRNGYTEQFKKDFDAHIKKVANALKEFGPASKEYWEAKIAKDIWFANNVNQSMLPEYYREVNDNNKTAFENATEEFLEYQALVEELKTISGNNAELDRVDLLRKKDILAKLSFFTSKFNPDGTEKSAEKQARLKYIKDWKIKKREIRNKYFDTSVLDEVKDKINECVSYIKDYDSKHPDETLDEKKADDLYREYYDWLQYNTTFSLNEESNNRLLDAYSKFSNGENDRQIRIYNILKGKDVYDEYGNLDPTKISIEDMEKIKELYENENTKLYEDNNAESSLIKCVGNLPVVCVDDYYKLMNEVFDGKNKNIKKLQLVKKINEYLIKCVDESGNLNPKLIFNRLTNDEVIKLTDLIADYKNLNKEVLSDDQVETLKQLHKSRSIDFTKFNNDLAWANANLSDKQLVLFKRIFCDTDKYGRIKIRRRNGKKYNIGSPLFYSISSPRDTWIDVEKTNAKRFINNVVDYTIKDEYYEMRGKLLSRANAIGDMTDYNRWYKANHIYNPATHRMEPLMIWKTRTFNSINAAINYQQTVTDRKGNKTAVDITGYTTPFNGEFEYNPAYEHTKYEAKETNPNYNPDAMYDNYNGNSTYSQSVVLNEKEKAMRNYIYNVMNKLATTNTMRHKAKDGFMPRRTKLVKDGKYYLRQGLGSLGLDWVSFHHKQYSDELNYENERDGDLNVLQELRGKGTIDIASIDKIGKTEEEYQKEVEEARANNARIDAELRDEDWPSILRDYVETATIYNAKEELKYTSLLLLEDLKHSNAMAVNYRDNVSISRKRSTNYNQVPNEVPQTNTIDIVETWHKRVFRNQFKKKSKYNEVASLMQNMTSAKYMIFNVTGGIANVWTGVGNILGETFADDYLSNKEFAEAATQYGGNLFNFFAEMYSEKSSTLTGALIKRFNVVDYEAFSERRPDESLNEYIKRFRNLLYGLQSGGEHFMQNTVLLGMLKSHRLYTDYRGKTVAGTFMNYVQELESNTLINLLKDKKELINRYKLFLADIRSNKEELYKYETLKKDINTEFVRSLEDKEIVKAYIEAKKEAYKKAEKEFYNDNNHPTLESQFILSNGMAVLKSDSPIHKIQLGDFTNKVIYVNKKIHGVYDKVGAAQIEKEWWGSLVMQYHKHLYPGFMKRWRINGYFNEQIAGKEKGSYISAINLLTIDFDKALNVAKNDAQGQKAKLIIKSVQNIAIQAINNLRQINTNFQLLPRWEQNNIRRSYADSLNTLACIAMAIGIHIAYDEDEIKDSNTISTMVYLADRFASEAQAFTPWGAYGEAKTLYSSPIASTNTPSDLIKLIGLIGQTLIDPEFETNYSTGLYKGRNKFEVLLTRNIPIVRIKNRLEMMSKNNQYYRLNENMLNVIPVKDIANEIAGRD